MNSFGKIKSKIEKLLEKSYGTDNFKTYLKGFKKYVLNKKNISEMYFLYDELSSNKGLNESIVDDYISESFDYLKKLIDKNQSDIETLDKWVNDLLKEDIENSYSDIDKQLYTKNVVKNLESLIESKNRIRKVLLSERKKTDTLSFNIPISSMLQIATKTFNKEFSNLNEEEKKELKYFTSLKHKDLSKEIEETKKVVLEKLSLNLNESTDKDLNDKLNETIERINKTETNLISLYKLKQLEKGLL